MDENHTRAPDGIQLRLEKGERHAGSIDPPASLDDASVRHFAQLVLYLITPLSAHDQRRVLNRALQILDRVD